MDKNGKRILIAAAAAVLFLAMVAVNALANILPINGVNTGQVSDSYPNLFAPAGVTFSIWGLIYLLLAVHTGYRLFRLKYAGPESESALLDGTGILYSVSSAANILWILAWHYGLIPLSMLLMAVILVCLILTARKTAAAPLSRKEKIFIKIPFNIYFGWITVAAIANVTALLVSLGFTGGGAEQVWTVVILITGMVIAALTTVAISCVSYGLVPVWAYAGIILKHVSAEGFASRYPGVIVTAYLCIALLLTVVAYTLVKVRKKAKKA